MQSQRICLTTLITFLANVSTPFPVNFLVLFPASSAVAQTQVAPYNWERKGTTPSRRTISGTRGGWGTLGNCSKNAEHLTAIVPVPSPTLTVAEYPTFFIYVPETSVPVEFFLQDEDKRTVYTTTFTITGTPGIISLSLPADGTLQPLEIGKTYHWYFSLICNSPSGYRNPWVEGSLQRVKPSPNLVSKLKNAEPQEHSALYAEAGIWHEAITTLAELRRSYPNNLKIASDWSRLLDSAGLRFEVPLVLQTMVQIQGARKTKADLLLQQGLKQYENSQFETALRSFQQALTGYRELQDRLGQAKAINNLGLAYYRLGDFSTAIAHQQQSLTLAHGIQDSKTEGRALGNLGLIYQDLGDYVKAIEYLQQSLALAKKLNDREGEGQALGRIGLAYHALGDHNKAVKYHQQHLSIAQQLSSHYEEEVALNNLGLAYDALGDYVKAIEYLQQSLALAKKLNDRLTKGRVLGNLGLAYHSLGKHAKTVKYLQQHLAIAQEINDHQAEGGALNNLGLVLFEQGKFEEAERTLRTGIQVWESLRTELNDANKVSIFETQATTYRLLQEVLIAQKKVDTALEVAERSRARAFVELLATRLSSQGFLQEAIAPPTLGQIQQIAKAQNATLIEYSVIYDEFKVQGKQQIRESELYIWVIKPTGEVTFRQADLKPLWQQENTSLYDLVAITRDSIGVRGRGVAVLPRPNAPQARTRLERLHELLINPIADLLPTDPNARVTFIPQGELFLVPFPALQDKSGKYLVEQHTILTAPSIQVLELTRQQQVKVQKAALKEAIVLGNPTMPSVSLKLGESPEQLAPLPGAEQEAKAIAPLLQTQALTGGKATETAIKQKMSQAGMIHLATHGLLDDFKGLGVPGAIVLAPSGKDDGLLTANEILDMKLNAELVVLSACDTGRGRITGDGVIGLSRSLISAGVPSVIVSLWSVPDAPTASLMTQFYQNLQQNPDKAQALRQAMLKTMKQHPEPKDWAAFTLIGEAE